LGEAIKKGENHDEKQSPGNWIYTREREGRTQEAWTIPVSGAVEERMRDVVDAVIREGSNTEVRNC
jgi:hypothetical protein